MKSSASQALPPALTAAEKPLTPETSTPNQSKNMKMKSRIAETAGDLLSRAQPVYVHLHPPSVDRATVRGSSPTLHPAARGGGATC